MFHSTKRTTEKPRSKAAPTTPKGTLAKTPTPEVDSEEESLKSLPIMSYQTLDS